MKTNILDTTQNMSNYRTKSQYALHVIIIQGVSKMLGHISGVRSLHQNKEGSSYQYMSAKNFRGTYSMFAQFQSFRFLSVGIFKNP
jgi:hypothetical protein